MAGYSDPGFDTLALHAGAAPDPTTGARAVPIHLTTSFVFESTDQAAALFNLERPGHVYSRISNPTNAVLEQRISALARVAELTSALDGQVGGGTAGAGEAFGPLASSVSSASAGGGGDGTSGRRMSDAERVAVLEKQVSGLQQLLERRTAVTKGSAGGGARGRGGDRGGRGRSGSMPSVAELIAAAGPTPQEVQRTAFLETRVSQLEETVCELEATHSKRLRALRQQSERVAAGYEAKVALLSDKLQKAEALLEAVTKLLGPSLPKEFGGHLEAEVISEVRCRDSLGFIPDMPCALPSC
jgi:hypothetical protein